MIVIVIKSNLVKQIELILFNQFQWSVTIADDTFSIAITMTIMTKTNQNKGDQLFDNNNQD